jgi:hypothetical protein
LPQAAARPLLQGCDLPAATNCSGGEKHHRKSDPHRPHGDLLCSPDLLLKHLDATPATYKKKTDEKHAFETLTKTTENSYLLLQYSSETLATYI